MASLRHQLEMFSPHAENSSDEVCEAFLRAVLTDRCCDDLLQLASCAHLHHLVWHALSLSLTIMSESQRNTACRTVFTCLLTKSESETGYSARLVATAARLLSQTGCAAILDQVLEVLTPDQEDDEAWSENDKLVLRLDCVLALLQKLLLIDGACGEELSLKVLPILLCVLQEFEASDVRKTKILYVLHVFYVKENEQDILALWRAVEKSDPDLALALLCRLCVHLKKNRGFGSLLQLPSFWSFVFERMEQTGLRKNNPLALSKQAMFLLRETVEACVAEKIVVNAEPWMMWNPKKSTARDWNAYLTLFELLEQYSIHLIEPV
jgi:hypothetical protein